MTKTRRTQSGGWDWPSFLTKKEETNNSVAVPADAPVAPVEVQKPWYKIFGGSRRRRRRCTKKHSHSSACKRKSKGRKSYRKRR